MKFPRNLKIATTPSTTPVVDETANDTAVSEIDTRLLKLLAGKLNFQYTIHLLEDGGGYGVLSKNGRWTGVVGILARGEADLFTAYSHITKERLHSIEYSTIYYVLEKTFATDIPELLSKCEVLLLPFHTDVWLGYLISFGLIPNVL
ncbi:lig_chan-Glu_bd domain-containing protein [Nephila pilipes]|uniref:Lig_chan-Glu_bd domain-containing protein n=1 Tax=Nephila pilipes TaxID=299642 RepID=A0A8X6MLH1_NEPPI|nr:lig_chan-Glu_bd domain-containing protein [Nephila pilipes]